MRLLKGLFSRHVEVSLSREDRERLEGAELQAAALFDTAQELVQMLHATREAIEALLEEKKQDGVRETKGREARSTDGENHKGKSKGPL